MSPPRLQRRTTEDTPLVEAVGGAVPAGVNVAELGFSVGRPQRWVGAGEGGLTADDTEAVAVAKTVLVGADEA